MSTLNVHVALLPAVSTTTNSCAVWPTGNRLALSIPAVSATENTSQLSDVVGGAKLTFREHMPGSDQRDTLAGQAVAVRKQN